MTLGKRAMQTQFVRVIYPIDGGRITLRTEENCDSNIEANSIRQNGCVSEFQIETELPYFYFKAVLLRDGIALSLRGAHLPALSNRSPLLAIARHSSQDAPFT